MWRLLGGRLANQLVFVSHSKRQSKRIMAVLTPLTVDMVGHDDPGQQVFKIIKDVASMATLHTCVDERFCNS
jgi:hypothetical protein